MRHLIATAAAVTTLLILASALGHRPVAIAHPGETGVHLALDCNVVGGPAGVVDDSCTVPVGTYPVIDVSVASNGPSFQLKKFTLNVTVDQTQFEPWPVTTGGTYSPGSPVAIGGWICSPSPQADTNPSPTVATTFISCEKMSGYPTIPSDGTHIPIAEMRWDNAVTTPAATFSISSAIIYDSTGAEVGSCGGLGSLPVNCYGATYTVTDPGTAGVNVLLDCDAISPGVQDVCPLPVGTTTLDVGIYVRNNGAPAFGVGYLLLTVSADQTMLVPVPDPDPNIDGNPDLAPMSGTWACSPPGTQPDADPSPAAARSRIMCLVSDAGPAVATNGTPFLLATVRYNVVGPPTMNTPLRFGITEVGDNFGVYQASCTADPYAPAPCRPARVYLTDDWDGDGRTDLTDNCVYVANPDQANNDAIYDVTPPLAANDATRPNSDTMGDVCDNDDDNDGLSDVAEGSGSPCASATASTDPLKDDSDGDRYLDGIECTNGADPANSGSKPNLMDCGAANDPDGDGVLTFREVCFYNTNPSASDTDGDGCPDGKEVGSVNPDHAVNAIDLSQVAQHFAPNSTAPAYHANFDLTKDDGRIDSLDLGRVAQQYGPC